MAESLLNAEAFRFQNFVILVEECIKNCDFFDPNELKSLFYSAHLHVCMSTKLARVLNNVARSSSILMVAVLCVRLRNEWSRRQSV